MGYWYTIETPVGPLCPVVNQGGALLHVFFSLEPPLQIRDSFEKNKYRLGAVALELQEYFAGERKSFALEFHTEGTPFYKEVWYRLGKVPYGTTISYAELARKAGRKDAVRAVANAVALNPLPIIIPCHRVIRSDGSLGYYAKRSLPDEEGRAWKQFLLGVESKTQL